MPLYNKRELEEWYICNLPGKESVEKTGINHFNLVQIEAISLDSSPNSAGNLFPPLPVPEHPPDLAADGLGQDFGALDLARVFIRPE